jgi:hypothetical protein
MHTSSGAKSTTFNFSLSKSLIYWDVGIFEISLNNLLCASLLAVNNFLKRFVIFLALISSNFSLSVFFWKVLLFMFCFIVLKLFSLS